MNVFSVLPIVIKAIEWFIANEPAIEKDAVIILSKAKDILLKLHDLRSDVAGADGK